MGSSQIMTLANSVIGVSILAMPYCFKQCGIILSIVMLLMSSIVTRVICHLLLKSAVMARRRNFEFLAFHTFGQAGKFIVEVSIIGFLLGTCVAFFVVMGDLGPVIVSKIIGRDDAHSLRPMVLIGLASCVILPLGLLKNVDSLATVSTASIVFYLCLVVKVILESTTHLVEGDWLDKVNLWRPAGILQCIPIFSMALSCQTQVFEIYDSLPDPSLGKMNEVVRAAINMCTGVYICVGFFGYVAFCHQNFSGNILMSFTPSMTTEIIKLAFVLSVAVGFPLVVFPCRASLHSLLFRRVQGPHEIVSNYIPEIRFKCLTVFLIAVSLILGLLIPNIELVLGLVGSTIGTVICIIFPAVMFIRISSKHTNERLLAQIIFFLGVLILFLGTYANLYAVDQAQSEMDRPIPVAVVSEKPDLKAVAEESKRLANEASLKQKEQQQEVAKAVENIAQVLKDVKNEPPDVVEKTRDKIIIKPQNEDSPKKVEAPSDTRQEPPVPVEPDHHVDDVKEKKQDEEVIKEVEGEKKEVSDQINPDAIRKEEQEIVVEEVKDLKKKEEEKKDDEHRHEEILKRLEENHKDQETILKQQDQILKLIEQKEEKLEKAEKIQVEVKQDSSRNGEVNIPAQEQSVDLKKGLQESMPKLENEINKNNEQSQYLVQPVNNIKDTRQIVQQQQQQQPLQQQQPVQQQAVHIQQLPSNQQQLPQQDTLTNNKKSKPLMSLDRLVPSENSVKQSKNNDDQVPYLVKNNNVNLTGMQKKQDTFAQRDSAPVQQFQADSPPAVSQQLPSYFGNLGKQNNGKESLQVNIEPQPKANVVLAQDNNNQQQNIILPERPPEIANKINEQEVPQKKPDNSAKRDILQQKDDINDQNLRIKREAGDELEAQETDSSVVNNSDVKRVEMVRTENEKVEVENIPLIKQPLVLSFPTHNDQLNLNALEANPANLEVDLNVKPQQRELKSATDDIVRSETKTNACEKSGDEKT